MHVQYPKRWQPGGPQARLRANEHPLLTEAKQRERTRDHLPGVVDDALVVLVLSMGEVHPNWRPTRLLHTW